MVQENPFWCPTCLTTAMYLIDILDLFYSTTQRDQATNCTLPMTVECWLNRLLEGDGAPQQRWVSVHAGMFTQPCSEAQSVCVLRHPERWTFHAVSYVTLPVRFWWFHTFFGCSRFTYYFVEDWTQPCNKSGIGVRAGFCFNQQCGYRQW